MTNRSAVDRWADSEGFRPAVAFEGRRSYLDGTTDARYSGFYILYFDDDTYYLGESVDLRSRMGGHAAQWGDEIAEVRFLLRSLTKQQLRAVERGLIRGLNAIVPKRCRNSTHASFTAHKNELADLLDDDEQVAWLADALGFNSRDSSLLKPMPAEQIVKYSTAAARLSERPDHEQVIETLRNYLERCVPAPRRTEFHGWNVSTGTAGGARLLCVSVGRMESFVVFGDGSGFVNVPAVSVDDEEARRILDLHPDLHRMGHREYADFGDVTLIHAESLDALRALLADSSVCRAAQQLAYSVMRKHPSVYTRYHCPQVVEAVYPASTRPASNDDAIESIRPSAPVEVVEATAPRPLPALPPKEAVDAVPDDVRIDWFVTPGGVGSGRNQPDDFRKNREWRTDRSERFDHKVQEMLAGERIAVTRRRNVTADVPFDRRERLVSVMEILMTGVIAHNPGDGVSVGVDWDDTAPPRRWYLYTSQDTVWPVPLGISRYYDLLSAFTFDGAEQDTDFWRNEPFWRERFGDH
jgi:hypothetical protein